MRPLCPVWCVQYICLNCQGKCCAPFLGHTANDLSRLTKHGGRPLVWHYGSFRRKDKPYFDETSSKIMRSIPGSWLAFPQGSTFACARERRRRRTSHDTATIRSQSHRGPHPTRRLTLRRHSGRLPASSFPTKYP